MIFNPLFIGENGNMQSLAPKSGKLASNKYLFSDIVKVVMNPSKKGNGKQTINLDSVDTNLKLGIEGEQKLIQLKYRLLTDEHSEQVKSELADLLPHDIAQLLISDEFVASSERAVSYVSKDPLKGELQNFLNNLIGAEIIEQNISQKSGLLLNLEDKKSAVNIELVEDGKGKSASDKIVVQTLVVPEKSRLFSMLGNQNNNEIFFRTSGTSTDQIFATNGEIKLTNGQSEIIKPVLSVYSFSRDGNHFESLTKSIRSNETLKHNLDLLKINNETTNLSASKGNLEKISFIPSEIKNSNINSDNLQAKESVNKVNTDLKLVTNNETRKDSDFSVSKITIVKKQDENSFISSIKSKSEISSKEFESALRRIDFNKRIENQKLELYNIKNAQSEISNNNKEELKISNSSIKGTINNYAEHADKNADINLSEQTVGKDNKNETNKLVSKINVENEKSIASKNNEVKVENKSVSAKLDTKNVQPEKLIVDLKLNKSENNTQTVNTDEKKTEKSDQIKVQTKNQLSNEVKNSTDGKSLSEKFINEIKSVNIDSKINDTAKLFDKNERSLNLKSDIKNNAVEINNDNASKSQIPSKENPELKIDLKNNLSDQEKSLSNNQGSKSTDKDVSQIQKEPNEVKQAAQNAVNPNIENSEAKENKKFSIKVKSGIKSVSDSIKNTTEDNRANSNSASSESSKSESSESKQTQNSSMPNNQFEMKQHVETNFQQTLNKNEIGQLNFSEHRTLFDEPKTESRIIKSVEIIKGISEFISKQEKGILSFDIRPEHLGKMKITLDTVDKMLKANIEVESEQAKLLVEKNIDKLHQQLSNNGLQLNSLNISLSYSKQQRNEKNINNKSTNDSENLGQVGETEEEKSKKQLGYNTYEYIA